MGIVAAQSVVDLDTLVDDTVVVPEAPAAPGGLEAFTVIHRAPKRLKIMPAVGARLRSDHIAISVLRLDSTEQSDNTSVAVSMHSADDSKTRLLGVSDFVKTAIRTSFSSRSGSVTLRSIASTRLSFTIVTARQ